MNETFFAYITKYALTSGLQRVEVEATEFPSMVCATDRDRPHDCYHGEGEEWHRTWESALSRAEKMREDKLKSIEKQRAKLEKMVFKRPED